MSNPPWRPLSQRIASQPIDEELLEGVPDHLEGPLLDWIRSGVGGDSLRTLVLRLRITVAPDVGWERTAFERLQAHMDHLENLIDVLDALLRIRAEAALQAHYAAAAPSRQRGLTPRDPHPQLLDHLLREGGSAWRVSKDGTELERRVDEAVSELVQKAAHAAASSAADHLHTAWHEVYSRTPDPTKAYSEAVKAVEAAAIPIVCPTNAKATISTVRGDLDKTPLAWELAIVNWEGASNAVPVVQMLRLLE